MNALIGYRVIVVREPETFVEVKVVSWDGRKYTVVDGSGKLTDVDQDDIRVNGNNFHQLFCPSTTNRFPVTSPEPPEESETVDETIT